MIRKIVALLFVGLVAIPQLVQADVKAQLFVSQENSFSVQYPSSWNRWNQDQHVHPETVLQVVSPQGHDLVVVVTANELFRDVTPQEFADVLSKAKSHQIVEPLARNYPDVHLVQSGVTTLSQQPAFFYEVEFSLNAAGVRVPWSALAIMTKFRNKQYTLTFRSPTTIFPEYRAIIKMIALSFQLIKR